MRYAIQPKANVTMAIVKFQNAGQKHVMICHAIIMNSASLTNMIVTMDIVDTFQNASPKLAATFTVVKLKYAT